MTTQEVAYVSPERRAFADLVWDQRFGSPRPCADSHPFWTGRRRLVDAAGQVEKFHRRYGQRDGTSH
jgi:hypothetical protein